MTTKKLLLMVSVISLCAGCSLKEAYRVGEHCEKPPEYYVDNGKIIQFGENESESAEFALNLQNCPSEYPHCALDKNGVQYCHQTCENGVDEDGQVIVAAFCNRSCGSTMQDNVFCGAKGDCWSDDPDDPNYKGEICQSGEACSNGKCVMNCSSGTHLNEKTSLCEPDSNENCGAVGNRCVGDQICSQGKCATNCDSDEIKCKQDGSEICVNPKSNVKFCGADNECQGFESCNGDQNCIGGVCVCKEGKQACEDLCCSQVAHGYVTCDGGTCGYVCEEGYVDNGVQCCLSVANGNIVKDNGSVCKFECNDGFVPNGNTCVTENCTDDEKICINSINGIGEIHKCVNNEWVKEKNCESSNACLTDGLSCGECQQGYSKCTDSSLETCENGTLSTTECTTNVLHAKGICSSAVSCGAYECLPGFVDNGVMCCPEVDNGSIIKDNSTTCHFNCANDYVPMGNSCVKKNCDNGEQQCANLSNNAGQLQECVNNTWTVKKDCDNGYSCNEDNKTCSKNCTNGTNKCTNNGDGKDDSLYTCIKGEWIKSSDCVSAVMHSNGKCRNTSACGGYKCHNGYKDTGSVCVSAESFCEMDENDQRCVPVGEDEQGAGKLQSCSKHMWQDTSSCNGNSCQNEHDCGECLSNTEICRTPEGSNIGLHKACEGGIWSQETNCSSDNSCSSMTSCGECQNTKTKCEGTTAIRTCANGAWGPSENCPVPENGSPTCSNGVCSFKCNTGYRKVNNQCVLNILDCGSSHINCTTSFEHWQEGSCTGGQCKVTSCEGDGEFEYVPSMDGTACLKKYYNCRKDFPEYSTNTDYEYGYGNDHNYFCAKGPDCAQIKDIISSRPEACVRWMEDCSNKTSDKPYQYYACQDPAGCYHSPQNRTELVGDNSCTYHPRKYFDRSNASTAGEYTFKDCYSFCSGYNPDAITYACMDGEACNHNPSLYQDQCVLKWIECEPDIFCKFKSLSECKSIGINYNNCIALTK